MHCYASHTEHNKNVSTWKGLVASFVERSVSPNRVSTGGLNSERKEGAEANALNQWKSVNACVNACVSKSQSESDNGASAHQSTSCRCAAMHDVVVSEDYA